MASSPETIPAPESGSSHERGATTEANMGHPAPPTQSAPPRQSAPPGQAAPHGQSGPPGGQPNQPRPSGPPPGRPMAPPPPSTAQQVRTWLAHPLLLLIIGSMVTGILVPNFTGKYQKTQTAQEMKTQVIGDVTTAVSIPITQLSVTQNPVFTSSATQQINHNNVAGTYAAFLSKSSSVDSEVKAYFPENRIPIHWENLTGLLQNFYLITYATDPGMKQGYMQSIKHYFDVHHTSGGINWGLLVHGSWQTHGYYKTWQEVEKKIVGVKVIVLSGIMDAPPPSF